jgi:two-component system sensor histidine kinase VicK
MPEALPFALPDSIFHLIFKKSPGSLLVKADMPRFTIVAISDSYPGITPEEGQNLIGNAFFDVFPIGGQTVNDDINSPNLFTGVIQTHKKIDIPHYRYDVYNEETDNHEIRYWSGCNTPIFDADNQVAYILNTVVDITGEVLARQSAVENEQRLRLAAEAAALATWDLDLTNQRFIYSTRLAEIFGHAPGTSITLAELRSQVNVNDMKDIVIKAFQEALITGNYLYEVRVYWPDGSLHWIKTLGQVLFDENKKPIRTLGTILDITDSKSDEIRKNEFLAIASHELKTPLTSLKAFLQILARKMPATNDSFVNSLVDKANNQVNRMTDLVNGFLSLSKIEPGTLQLKIESFDINKLIENAIVETKLTNTGHIIYFDLAEKIIINGDKEKIDLVINNFLSNAIKYSPKGTPVTVKSVKTGSFVQVSVADEGIGIKAKDQQKLFQRFYRVENEKMKNVSGFGIGLYLAGEIIQRHQGKIWVESEESAGSTFYFTLPLPQ